MECINNSGSADFTSQFKKNLEKSHLFSKILCLDLTSSTNDDVRSLLSQDDMEGPVCVIAQRQTAGRGTHGRVWAEVTESVLLSIGMRLDRPVQDYVGVTLAIGAYIVRSLRELGCGVSMKWPNDLWSASGKAGGILTEIVACGKSKAIIVGVGVNITVHHHDDAYGVSGATAIEMPLNLSRVDVATNVARAALQAVLKFDADVLRDISESWHQLDAFYGQLVEVLDESHKPLYQARLSGLTPQGALIVRRVDGRTVSVMSGSVRLVV